jgi:hypothetical protein
MMVFSVDFIRIRQPFEGFLLQGRVMELGNSITSGAHHLPGLMECIENPAKNVASEVFNCK